MEATGLGPACRVAQILGIHCPKSGEPNGEEHGT